MLIGCVVWIDVFGFVLNVRCCILVYCWVVVYLICYRLRYILWVCLCYVGLIWVWFEVCFVVGFCWWLVVVLLLCSWIVCVAVFGLICVVNALCVVVIMIWRLLGFEYRLFIVVFDCGLSCGCCCWMVDLCMLSCYFVVWCYVVVIMFLCCFLVDLNLFVVCCSFWLSICLW